jgi:hypothetical protein
MKHFTLPSLLALLFILLLVSSSQSRDDNLIQNSGFEEGSEGHAAHWTFQGDATLVTDEVHSGEQAVRVSSQGRSAGIKSNWFQAAPHERVEVSAWIKAQDVEERGHYQKLRVTLSAYRSDQITRIQHWDLASTSGTLDWTLMRGSAIMPEGTAYLQVDLRLTDTAGTFWADDVEARTIQTVPEIDFSRLEPPVIIPEPLHLHTSGEYIPLHALVIRSCPASDRFNAAIDVFLQQLGIPYHHSSFDYRTDFESGHLIFGGDCNDFLEWQLEYFDETLSMEDLGDQGYLIKIEVHNEQPIIYLSAGSEAGLYYAMQTLKHLINPRERTLLHAQVLDRPTLEQRGVIMGVQWFNEQDEFFERMSQLKLNMIWNQGSFMNEKFWFRWREPLDQRERDQLQNYLGNARAHFVEPHITIAPRGRNAGDPTYYSSERDINLIVSKFTDLYSLGFRNFGLSFDDLANHGQDRLFGPDQEVFDNQLGEAHRYFVEQVYLQLRSLDGDIQLSVVPMVYARLDAMSSADQAYLEALSLLSNEIVLYSSPEYQEEAELVREITKRRHMVWDNFYAYSYQDQAPEFIIPVDRPPDFQGHVVKGYTFLPLIPIHEDAGLVSWRTAANYAWAPERHDPKRAFQLAVAQHISWRYGFTVE